MANCTIDPASRCHAERVDVLSSPCPRRRRRRPALTAPALAGMKDAGWCKRRIVNRPSGKPPRIYFDGFRNGTGLWKARQKQRMSVICSAVEPDSKFPERTTMVMTIMVMSAQLSFSEAVWRWSPCSNQKSSSISLESQSPLMRPHGDDIRSFSPFLCPSHKRATKHC